MTIYTDRIILVFPIASKNRVAAASLQTLEVTEAGKEFESLIPLDPALVKDYATEFNLSALGQVTVLEAEKANLTTSLSEANATIATLQAQIDKLVVYRPFNPRFTTAPFFISRFTAQEAKAFFSSDDPTLVGGQTLFDAYEANNWYIDLDDVQVQGLTQYMVSLGIFTEDRRKQVLRDATAQEAYYPPEVVV